MLAFLEAIFPRGAARSAMLLVLPVIGVLLMMQGFASLRVSATSGELKVVVGFAAGSGVDAIARVVAAHRSNG
jgi:tripartite-type tricarboxylate transporter receptor subunit TctC